jgi:L-aspartate oxidase
MTDRRITVAHDSRPIIIGSGIAGLTTALSLEGSIVITSQSVGYGSSNLAQGGMAAALASDDDPSDHARDTIAVGGGIGDVALAEMIASEAPARIEWLRRAGAEFDTMQSGALALGREAGHSHRRIVHAGGDATGAEIMRALRLATVLRGDIEIQTGTRLVDLVRAGDRIVGVLTVGMDGSLVARIGIAVVLATGGIGGIYRRSTNPSEVTGAGLAAAARQGVTLADLEFVQFHPTALAAVDHPAPLISEALRGEGATLIDESGTRFMAGLHRDAELAPRDLVARAIWMHQAAGHRVYLDATRAIGRAMPTRFPTAFRSAMALGIDPRSEPMEILPAEHFHMGGVATDHDGRTSARGLWAAGEVASTGVHGANRLASNSLLEAAVMGERVAASIAEDQPAQPTSADLAIPATALARVDMGLDRDEPTIRSLSWSHLGIVRDALGISRAIEELDALPDPPTDAATVARLIATGALAREESRGAHFRADHPEPVHAMAARSIHRPEPDPVIGCATAGAMAS